MVYLHKGLVKCSSVTRWFGYTRFQLYGGSVIQGLSYTVVQSQGVQLLGIQLHGGSVARTSCHRSGLKLVDVVLKELKCVLPFV